MAKRRRRRAHKRATARTAGYRFTEKGRCRWCGEAVERPRRSWCSDECVEAYKVRAWPNHARRLVWRRDRGVCAICRLDCHALEAAVDNATGARRLAERDALLLDAHYRTDDWRRSLWQADHIEPVCEGGGACGLDNLRTLCVPCHKRETAALAKQRAATRRAKMMKPDGSIVPIEGDNLDDIAEQFAKLQRGSVEDQMAPVPIPPRQLKAVEAMDRAARRKWRSEERKRLRRRARKAVRQ